MAIHCVIKYNAGMTKLWKKGKSNKIKLLQYERMKNVSENILKCSACGKTFTNSYSLKDIPKVYIGKNFSINWFKRLKLVNIVVGVVPIVN